MWSDTTLVAAITQPEVSYLLYSFLAAVFFCFVLEMLSPAVAQGYGARASRNSILLLLNSLLKFLLPFSLVAASLFALFQQFGLLNMIKLGLWSKIFIAWLVLDLVSYWLHRAYHRFAFLWRIHRLHHSDQALDLTTPFRTHPLEMIITTCVKAGIVVLFGMPLLGVILYQIVVAVMAVWVHANVHIPPLMERTIECLLITPGFHRQHHGDTRESCNRNFGLVLTVWDRIFGTVSVADRGAGPGVVHAFTPAQSESLSQLLLVPFRK